MAEPESWPIPWAAVEGDRGGALAHIEYAAFRGALELGSRLPTGMRRALVGGLAHTANLFDRRHTRAAQRFLEQALPSASAAERDELVLASWRHLIGLALEDARYNAEVEGSSVLAHFELDVSDDVRRAIELGRGGLGITPHVGNWEALPHVGRALGASPFYAVMKPPRNRYLARYIQRVREARGFRVIHKKGAFDQIRNIVGAGGWVGLLLDQRARGRKVLYAPFFGRPAACERGVALLARRMRAPLVFGACYLTDRPFHYRAVMKRVMWPEELEGLDAETLATAINRELEALILAAPSQYLWLHDRYYKAPATLAEAQ